jgi:YD repeat-containing protein
MSSSDSDVTAIARYAPDDRIERIAALGANGQLLRTLYYVYDSERRLTEVRDGEGQPLRQLAYVDGDVLPDRTIDPLGHDTWLTYDALGRLASVLAADGGMTRLERDAFGRTTRLIAPNDAQTAFLYDDFGRRVRERSAAWGNDPAGVRCRKSIDKSCA